MTLKLASNALLNSLKVVSLLKSLASGLFKKLLKVTK